MTDRGTTWLAGIALVVCLGAASVLAAAVKQQREDLRLIVEMRGISGMPPHVAVVTAALGTFRGLAVDILWARAEQLEREGEYYEAQTLAQWITTLQPRFKKVWWFQSFNLAWNITAATQVPAERWGWVTRGIELLRSGGIPLNPEAPDLYFDLAWIFENKIGSARDKEHWYYKSRLAAEMQEVLGDLTQGRTTAEVIDRFRKIADAPATLEALTEQVSGLDQALALLESHGAAADEATLRMLGRVMMQFSSLDAKILGAITLPKGVNPILLEALQENTEVAGVVFDHLVPFLQKRVLEDRYQMRPQRMLAVMERYGPLDWRHADAHGIYWSEEGMAVARTAATRGESNELMLVRGRLMMLTNLLRSGRVDYDPVTTRIDLLPDPRFAPKFEEALEEAIDLINSERGVAAADFGPAEEADLFATWETFLNLATMLTYLYGDETEAARYFNQYIKLAERQNFADEPALQGTLENFVAIRFADMAEVKLGDFRQIIDAMIRRGMQQGLAKGNVTVFERFLRLARSVYEKRFGAADRGEEFVLDEFRLLPFPKLVENSFVNTLKQSALPVMTRARMWVWAPEKLRQDTYEALAAVFEQDAARAGLDVARAFPAPVQDSEPSARQADD